MAGILSYPPVAVCAARLPCAGGIDPVKGAAPMSYQDPYGQSYGQSPYGYGYGAPARTTNGLALASMIVSIIALALCSGLPGIIGAIMGHVARRQVRERGEEGDGFALAGIIVGWIGFGIAIVATIFVVFIFVIAASTADEYSDPTYDPSYDWMHLLAA
jgi:hypothetical protein